MEKKCSKCEEVKDVTEFYIDKNVKSGVRAACKLCMNKQSILYSKSNENVEYQRRYYINNKERIVKRDKQYYNKNKEVIDTRRKKYNETNKIKKSLYSKKYYRENSKKLKQYGKQYTISNRDVINLKCKQRYNKDKKLIRLRSKKYYKENKQKLLGCNKDYYNTNAKYVLFVDKLTAEESPKLHSDGVSLEVLCKYCGKYFIPIYKRVKHRVDALYGEDGACYLYCSENCKQACPTFGQQKYPKGFKKASSREVNSLVRQMCFKRDGWECQICGKSINEVQLHCHHIEGYTQNPVMGNDIENVVTLCKECHKKVHKLPKCNYYELGCRD